MNVKVITRHSVNNYGSLLQTIATQRIICEMGCDCEIIDYQHPAEQGLSAILNQMKKKDAWNNNLLKKIIYIFLRFPEEKLMDLVFAKMREKHLNLTRRYSNIKEMEGMNGDLFLTGSDQVWGPTIAEKWDSAYFLTFVNDRNKKKAYAASFGRTDFCTNILQTYQQMLESYSRITVREDVALNVLSDMGIRGTQVLDPTLLLDNKQWSELINEKPKHPDKYVLIYQLHNNPILEDYAKILAKRKKLALYRITPSIHHISRSGKMVLLPTLGNFLSWIKNCSYLVTDSFHGTCFALNFNRQFIEVLPNNKTESRNQSILSLCGLTARIIRDYNDLSIVDIPIDYTKVNKIIVEERTKSMAVMAELLNSEY